MTRHLIVIVLTVTSALTVAPSAIAQSPPRFSLEASVGEGTGWTSGDYGGAHSELAVDVVLGARLRQLAGGGGLVAGLSGSAHGGGVYDLLEPRFPQFYLIAAAIGWENEGGGLRAMIGPAFVQPMSGDGRTVGVQGRLDVAGKVMPRLAIVASLRPALVPDYRGDMVGLLAIGIGLRLR